MNIQEDLTQRKEEIEKISAYSTLRKGIAFLIKLQKIALFIGMIIFIVIAFKNKHLGSAIFQILITLGITTISFVLLTVIEELLNSVIDGIDLQLLANRRKEIERKEEVTKVEKALLGVDDQGKIAFFLDFCTINQRNTL